MYLAVSCFFQPLQDLGVKDFQAVKCPSGKKVTLDIFDHIFHFSLAFRISRTAEHGLEMLLVDKGTERSCQYEVTQVFSDQQDFVLVIDYPLGFPPKYAKASSWAYTARADVKGVQEKYTNFCLERLITMTKK